ncbi:MAG: FtsX-like permease family protein [Planctomycetota bacterium]
MLFARRVPLAWRNVTANPRKFLLSVVGVTFAVVLMFAELGFLTGVINAQVRLIDKLAGDLVLVSSSKANMFVVQPFPRARLAQACGHPDVAAGWPVFVAMNVGWKEPREGQLRFLRLVAFDPSQPVFRDPELDALRPALAQPDTLVLDREMASYYGPRAAGLQTELEGHAVRVIGTYALGVDLPSRATAVCSDRTLLRAMSKAREPELQEVEIGLLKLRDGVSPGRALADLRRFLPEDVRLMTRDQFVNRERLYFLIETPIGAMFALGLVMGAVVAGFICYQILYADVLDNMGQYATLKAMGYAASSVGAVVMQQAVYLSLLGFGAGIGVAWLLYDFLARRTGFPMEITPWRAGAVFGLTLLACEVAAILAARKPLAADPAEAF